MVARRALDYNSPRILRALLYLIMTLQAARPSVRLVVAAVILYCAAAHADTHCHIVAPHDPTPAEKALLGGQAGEAETLYRDALSLPCSVGLTLEQQERVIAALALGESARPLA